MDVKTVFLIGKFKEKKEVELAKGFEIKWKENKVYKLTTHCIAWDNPLGIFDIH